VKGRICKLYLGLFIFLMYQTAFGQTSLFGGRGLYRTYSAEVVGSANLYVNGYFSSYFKKRSENLMAKDHTLNFGVTFGFFKHFEATLKLTPYQDDQQSIWAPPGDTRLGLKYHIPFFKSAFHLGLKCFADFPTANQANIMYEPFNTDEIGWGGHVLSTLSFANVFPLLPLKIHANVGYIDHSINDQFFTSIDDQMLLGFGIVFPIRSFQLFTEYSAEVFMNQPDIDFMQNSMRITQGFKFLGPKNIIFDLIFDLGLTNEDSVRVLEEKDESSPYIRDYADWKITFGATYRFSFKKYFDKSDAIAKQKELEEKRKLQKIKSKRENASKDLESMKKVLDRNVQEKKKNNK